MGSELTCNGYLLLEKLVVNGGIYALWYTKTYSNDLELKKDKNVHKLRNKREKR